MKKGVAGEKYLVGGPNWTLERYFKHLERVSKVAAPKFRIGKRFHSLASKTIEAIYDGLGKTPPVEPISMEMSRYFWYLDASKAKQELGFSSRDPNETLFDTVEYLRKHFLGADLFSTGSQTKI